jgi:chaperone LolA
MQIFLLTFLCLLSSFAVSANELNFKKISTNKNNLFEKKYQEVIKAAAQYEFFSVQFKQDLYSSLRDKVIKSEGVLVVKKPNSFRYEVTSPRKELYVSNGHDFWRFVPELKHAQQFQMHSQNLGFINILSNLSRLSNFYEVSEWVGDQPQKTDNDTNDLAVKSDLPPKQNDDLLYLKLLPKGDKQQKVLYAVIQVKTGFIQELRIVQLNGNRSRLVFANYSLKSILKEVFQFTPPKGIVVDKM